MRKKITILLNNLQLLYIDIKNTNEIQLNSLVRSLDSYLQKETFIKVFAEELFTKLF